MAPGCVKMAVKLLSLVLAAFCVHGCGDEVDDPAQRLAPGSSPPFTLVSTQPSPDQSDVPRNADIVLRFSDFPDPATLFYPWVSIGPRSDPVPFTSEVRLVDREVRFRPHRPLLAQTEIVVTVSRRLHALSGRPLGNSFRMVFRTGFALLPDAPVAIAPRLAELAGPSGIFAQRCAQAGCHRRDEAGFAAAGLDFAQDPRSLREHVLSDRRGGLDALRWVDVGRPEASYLLRKLLAAQPEAFVRITGSAMPLAQPPLSSDALRTIETWIRMGAN